MPIEVLEIGKKYQRYQSQDDTLLVFKGELLKVENERYKEVDLIFKLEKHYLGETFDIDTIKQ